MIPFELLIALSAGLLGLGCFWLLPHRLGTDKPWLLQAAGAACAALGVVAFAALWIEPFPGPSGPTAASQWLTGAFFYAFGTVAVSAAVMTVISRNPVHNALWFAVVLLATAGLFLLVDAQFLAAGTVVVYAGAIVVTFLFVIMLAQAEGHALYDRMARAPLGSTLAATLLFGLITFAVCMAREAPDKELRLTEAQRKAVAAAKGKSKNAASIAPDLDARLVRLADLGRRARGPDERGPLAILDRWRGPQAPEPHVAGLGTALYTDHLVAVEVAGALLFVGLVGAAAIATPRPHGRPGSPEVPS